MRRTFLQCNNGLLIKEETIADLYLQEWNKLQELGDETGNDLRTFNDDLGEKAAVSYDENYNNNADKVSIKQW